MKKSWMRNRICALVIVTASMAALAAVPRQIAYQGVLTDANGNPRPDGKYHFSFQLFSAVTGGSALPGFSQVESLTVKNGVFSTVLGKTGGINLPFDQQYWLGVTVNGTAMTQRVALGAAAYGIRSAVADSAVKAARSVKADTAVVVPGTASAGHTHSFLSASDGDPSRALIVDAQGRVGIGTENPTERITVSDSMLTNFIGLSLINRGNANAALKIANPFGTLILGQDWVHSTARLYLGSENFISLNISDTERVRVDPKGNVGIGTTAPVERLHVHHQTSSAIATTAGSQRFDIWNSGSSFNVTNGQESFVTVSKTGKVGIGSENPEAALQIGNSSKGGNILQSAQVGWRDAFKIARGDSIVAGLGVNENATALQFFTNNSYLTNQSVKMTIESNGKVGIGTTSPQYDLDVNGTIRGGNVAPSDRRFKTDITPIDSALIRISALQGVKYQWDASSFPERRFSNSRQIGLIAQEVESVLPELVHTDSEGYKSLSYDKLTAVLIEAVKEQQKTIDSQQQTIISLQESHTTQSRTLREQMSLISDLLTRVEALESGR